MKKNKGLISEYTNLFRPLLCVESPIHRMHDTGIILSLHLHHTTAFLFWLVWH